jgi:hypothetical protein
MSDNVFSGLGRGCSMDERITEWASTYFSSMTKAEIMDQGNWALDNAVGQTDTFFQLLFGFLIAMFLIAHRLSRTQFTAALVLYSSVVLLTGDQWLDRVIFFEAIERFLGGDPFHTFLNVKIPYFVPMLIVYCLMFAGSIWWAFSCRRNQPKEIGSPL